MKFPLAGNWPHGLGNNPYALGNWPHGLGNIPHALGNWPHGLCNFLLQVTGSMAKVIFLLL